MGDQRTLHFLVTSPLFYVCLSGVFIVVSIVFCVINLIFGLVHVKAAFTGLRALKHRKDPKTDLVKHSKHFFGNPYETDHKVVGSGVHRRTRRSYRNTVYASSESHDYFFPLIQPYTLSLLCLFNFGLLSCLVLIGCYNVGTSFLPISKSMPTFIKSYNFAGQLREKELPTTGTDAFMLRIIGAMSFLSICMILLCSCFAAYDMMWPAKLNSDKKGYLWCKRSVFKTLSGLLFVGVTLYLFFFNMTAPVDGIDVLNLIWFDELEPSIVGIVFLTILCVIFQAVAILMGYTICVIEDSESKLTSFKSFCCIGIALFMFYIVRFGFICFPSMNIKVIPVLVPLQIVFHLVFAGFTSIMTCLTARLYK